MPAPRMESECPRSIEIDPFLVRAFAETFIPRWDCYPVQVEDGRYAQISQPLTTTHISRHLTAHHVGMTPLTLGAYALDKHSQARWLCFDADADAQWTQLWGLARILTEQGITSYLEPSRRGGHLWLFTPSLSGSDIRQFGKHLLAVHKLSEFDDAGHRKIELYPKQDVLLEGAGSFVRLPLGVHRKTGLMYSFLTLDGKLLAATVRDQLRILANPNRIPIEYVTTVLNTRVELPTSPPKPTPTFKKRKPRHYEPLSESLKHAISVLDFVSRYIHLNEQGRGLCPFHDDHATSFAVNAARNYWHCFAGCGGGSIIDFWMQWRTAHGQDGSFAETVKELRHLLLTS